MDQQTAQQLVQAVERMGSLSALEVFSMGAEIVMAFASLAILASLLYHRNAVVLQREALQATMFSEISGRISSILGEIPPETEDDTKMFNWYIRLFNEFEAFIFLKNNGHLSPAMEAYYRYFIIEHVEKISEESPKIINHFKSLARTTFDDLRQYYINCTGKESPF